jgi:uncharacterized membrane protein HdeD (DUF308 family)
MNEPPPIPPMTALPRNQRNVDEDHLNLLSIFHFVVAALTLLGILFLLAHYALMHFMFTNPGIWKNQRGGPPPEAILGIFIIFYIIAGVFMVVIGILNVMSGFFLRERKNRTFSLVVAGIDCLQFPFGTILGVFTFVVLFRESVRALYDLAALR